MPIRLQACFDQMRTAAAREPHPSFAQREQWLQNLQGILREHAEDFCGAIESDFGSRSAHETRLLEVLPSLQAIEFALRHLRHWMVPEVAQDPRVGEISAPLQTRYGWHIVRLDRRIGGTLLPFEFAHERSGDTWLSARSAWP